MEKEKNKKNEKKIYGVLALLLLIVLVTGVSYAFILYSHTQSTSNDIKTSCLRLNFEDIDDSSINLDGAYPLTDTEAATLIPYKFKITNECENAITYDINLDVLKDENLLPQEFIAVKYNGGEKKILNSLTKVTSIPEDKKDTVNNIYKLDNDTLSANNSREYTLSMWMDESVPTTSASMNKIFRSKISVDAVISQS